MRFKGIFQASVALTIAAALAACASPGPRVLSNSAAHLPVAGESYFVVPARSDLESADFARYAAAADEALQARGFVRAANPEAAALLVTMDFGVARAEQRVWRRAPLSRFRAHLGNSDGRSGISTPRIPDARPQIASTPTSHDFVEVGIVRGSDNAALFEGIAARRTTPAKERPLEPLIQAIFAQWRPAGDAAS